MTIGEKFSPVPEEEMAKIESPKPEKPAADSDPSEEESEEDKSEQKKKWEAPESTDDAIERVRDEMETVYDTYDRLQQKIMDVTEGSERQEFGFILDFKIDEIRHWEDSLDNSMVLAAKIDQIAAKLDDFARQMQEALREMRKEIKKPKEESEKTKEEEDPRLRDWLKDLEDVQKTFRKSKREIKRINRWIRSEDEEKEAEGETEK
ncbi:hypothetical protein ACFL2D_01555 [Patescibacteria group bacterium]